MEPVYMGTKNDGLTNTLMRLLLLFDVRWFTEQRTRVIFTSLTCARHPIYQSYYLNQTSFHKPFATCNVCIPTQIETNLKFLSQYKSEIIISASSQQSWTLYHECKIQLLRNINRIRNTTKLWSRGSHKDNNKIQFRIKSITLPTYQIIDK